MTQLVLPTSLRERIEREAAAAYPDECCGILVGREEEGRRRVHRLEAMANVFDERDRRRRFRIDPVQQLRVERQADEEGLAVLGFYHSHPDHPARPSEYDRQHVPPWSFYSHVIVVVRKGAPMEMTCWFLDEQTLQFQPQELSVL